MQVETPVEKDRSGRHQLVHVATEVKDVPEREEGGGTGYPGALQRRGQFF